MKAILAASIALSPFAASTFSSPVKVEAATTDYSDVNALVDYLQKLYNLVDDKQPLLNVKDELEIIDWEKKAKSVAKKDLTTAQLQIIEDTLKVFSQVSFAGIKDSLDEFRKENIKVVFGESVTEQQLLNYLSRIELNFFDSIKNKNIEALTNDEVMKLFKEAIIISANDAKDVAILDKIEELIYIDKTISMLKDVYSGLGKDGKDARTQIIIALKKMQGENPTAPGGGSSSGGGGGSVSLPGGSTTVQNKGNEVITSITDAQVQGIVNAITEKNNVITIKLAKVTDGKIAKAEIAGALFTEAAKKNKNTIIAIETDAAVYKIPVSEINVASLANQLGVAAKDVKISIYVNVVKADVKNSASNVVEFLIKAESGDKKAAITAFSTYVDRVLVGTKDFGKGNSVAVRVNDNGTLTSLPTVFDGKNATVKSLTNSKYTVVENNITFKDVKENSWAKGYIETLANKLIVKGKTADEYAPADQMTRAEFTVLLVRALGLPAENYNNNFKDIKGNEWFNENGEIMAAVKHGLIEGVGNGNFAPKEKITRAQAAVMIERAMNLSFVNYDKSQLDSKKTIADFKDASKLQAWNKKAIEAVYQADIVSGRETKNFDPNGYTQRDEMAKILANFLKTAKLMN